MILNFRNIKPYLICVMICIIIELSAGFITQGSVNTWYNTIIKPDFTPPKWLFAPVWTLLYLMMGFAWGRINDVNPNPQVLKKANILFIIQLCFNVLWSFIYFGLHNIGIALIDIILLLVTLTLTIYQFFKISKLSGWLLIPYLFWSLYALVLNASIWYLNRDTFYL